MWGFNAQSARRDLENSSSDIAKVALNFKFSVLRFETMNWVQRKIYLYNVTFGLYMLDWWERCLFSILIFIDLSIS
ncbi:hypothetical protein CsSME_00005813 [Camellia sinensis var. sinensis]